VGFEETQKPFLEVPDQYTIKQAISPRPGSWVIDHDHDHDQSLLTTNQKFLNKNSDAEG
jgi:hypothetical protein